MRSPRNENRGGHTNVGGAWSKDEVVPREKAEPVEKRDGHSFDEDLQGTSSRVNESGAEQSEETGQSREGVCGLADAAGTDPSRESGRTERTDVEARCPAT